MSHGFCFGVVCTSSPMQLEVATCRMYVRSVGIGVSNQPSLLFELHVSTS